MTAHFELPSEPTKSGFRVETPRGTRFDVPHVERLADSMYDTELEWLWPGRVPLRKLTLIEGPPGCGKSFVAFSIAAIASSGAPWPGCLQGPQRQVPVLLLSKARSWDDMFSGRIERAQADIELCHRFTHISTWLPESGLRGEREVVFPYDAAALGAIISDLPPPRPKLIVVDALTDYCAEPGQLGRAVARLDETAADNGVAIVATLPASARRDGHGRLQVRPRGPDDRATCVWCIKEDPDDPRRRLFVPQRMTVCEGPGEPLAFRIRDGAVSWEGVAAGDVVEPWRELSEAAKWLRKVLAEGDLPASNLHRQARECGFSPKMLRVARQKLGVQVHRVGFGAEGHSVWSLAGAATATNGRAGNRLARRTTQSVGKGVPTRSVGTSARSVGTSGKRRTNGHAPVNRIAKISAE